MQRWRSWRMSEGIVTAGLVWQRKRRVKEIDEGGRGRKRRSWKIWEKGEKGNVLGQLGDCSLIAISSGITTDSILSFDKVYNVRTINRLHQIILIDTQWCIQRYSCHITYINHCAVNFRVQFYTFCLLLNQQLNVTMSMIMSCNNIYFYFGRPRF